MSEKKYTKTIRLCESRNEKLKEIGEFFNELSAQKTIDKLIDTYLELEVDRNKFKQLYFTEKQDLGDTKARIDIFYRAFYALKEIDR